jgi:hypothetical protein
MAFDRRLGAVVLFGGGNDENAEYADTWSWDGAAWTRLQPARSPEARTHMAVTSFRGHPFIFGGVRELSIYLADTWGWRSSVPA